MFYDPDWKKTIIESHRFWTKFLWKRNRSIWEPEVIKKNSLRFVDLFWIKDKTLGSGQLHHTCKQHFRHVNFCTSTFPTLKSIRFFLVLIRPTFFSIWSSHSHWQQCLSASDSIAVTFTIDLWTSGNMKKNYSYEE